MPKRSTQNFRCRGQIRPTDIAAHRRPGLQVGHLQPAGRRRRRPAVVRGARGRGQGRRDSRPAYRRSSPGQVSDDDATRSAGAAGRAAEARPRLSAAPARARPRSGRLPKAARHARCREILAAAQGRGLRHVAASPGASPTAGATPDRTWPTATPRRRHRRRRRRRHRRRREPAAPASRDLDIAIIEPRDIHYYQPGWTLVGGGVFDPATTARTMASLMPHGVHWIKAAVAAFEPEKNAVILEDCRVVNTAR